MSQQPRAAKRRDREYFEALDPATGEGMEVAVTKHRLQWVARRGMGAVKEAAFTVAETLRRPKVVFEGIRWDGDSDKESDADDWLCFCGLPERAYTVDGSDRAPYVDEVFLVFVNTEKVAYQWRWEACDGHNTTIPRDSARRFCRKAWPHEC